MTSQQKRNSVRSIKLEFSPEEEVTAFGGLAFLNRLALRTGFWRRLEKDLPERRGAYSWVEVIKSVVMGMATGLQGTYAAEGLREDQAALRLLGQKGAPEEATVWRSLEKIGSEGILNVMEDHLIRSTKDMISRLPRKRLLMEGFFPVFMDGTLLEGTPRREGTKDLREKGKGMGLLWTTVFAGPFCAAGRLAGKGEGENSCAKTLVSRVLKGIVQPLNFRSLVLADSLHGDGPTCDSLEAQEVKYILGARKLKKSEEILASQPEEVWAPTPEYDKKRKVENSAVCVCKIQCAEWSHARILIGRRWMNKGDMFPRYAAVLTNLTPDDLAAMKRRKGKNYAECVWSLYDKKQGCENLYKDLLIHLGLHHPPCRELTRNQGFYTLGLLAAFFLRAVDQIGVASIRDERYRSFATLRRLFIYIPARIATHARTAKATLLGTGRRLMERCQGLWSRLCRC